jgi:hypothetical protein
MNSPRPRSPKGSVRTVKDIRIRREANVYKSIKEENVHIIQEIKILN